MVFFLPFAVDIAVIILASRTHEMFWLYPILASAGSLVGGATTFYIGRRLGDVGLKHFIPKNQLAKLQNRIQNKGAVALALLGLIPPPFPFKAVMLAAGALKVNTVRFFIAVFLSRLLRFGAEAVLAYFYGRRIIAWLESDTVEYIGTALLAITIIGSAITAIQFVRKTRTHRSQRVRRAA
jgi:membrane protein YqaA with SNARE-associated domain